MKTYLYRASNFKSTITFWPQFHGGSQFLATAKNLFFLVIYSIIFINFFRRVFSECTEVIPTSLIPLDTIYSEECAFTIGFSCAMWTKMRSLLALWCTI